MLGVAKACSAPATLPGEQHDFTFEFLGLVGLADPMRPTVPAAVAECYAAGIRVVMITGDHPGTAQSIARQVGHASRPTRSSPAPSWTRWTTPNCGERVRTVNVFARDGAGAKAAAGERAARPTARSSP